jgi:hypothetical protein
VKRFDLILILNPFENGDLIVILNHIFGKWFDLILNHISDDFWIPCQLHNLSNEDKALLLDLGKFPQIFILNLCVRPGLYFRYLSISS